MTDYLSLTEFVPGTKAKAEEVNANFTALKDALNGNFAALNDAMNLKAAINGNEGAVFSVADASLSEHAVNLGVLEKTEDSITSKIEGVLGRFCLTSGNLTLGTADLLTYSGTTLSFKIGAGYNPLIWMSANGTKETVSSLANITGLSNNGTYSIIKELGVANATATASKVTQGAVMPISPADGDYHCLRDIELKTYKRISGAWVETQFIKLGSVTVSGSVISAVTTTPYNQNGYNINIKTQGYRFPDYANKISKLSNTVYQAECDGFIIATGYNIYMGAALLYIGITSTPSYLIASAGDDLNGYTKRFFLNGAVSKGEYYKLETIAIEDIEIYFIPAKGV